MFYEQVQLARLSCIKRNFDGNCTMHLSLSTFTANVVPLLQEERKLLTDEDIEACKFSYNTWAFVGDINNQPQLNCVWQSDDAQNEFLSNPKIGLGEDVYDKKSNEAADPRVIQSKKQSVSPSAIAAAMAAAAAAGASADQTPAP